MKKFEFEFKKYLDFVFKENGKSLNYFYKNLKIQKTISVYFISNKNNFCVYDYKNNKIYFDTKNKNYFNEFIAKYFNEKTKIEYLEKDYNTYNVAEPIKNKNYNNLYFEEYYYENCIRILFNGEN